MNAAFNRRSLMLLAAACAGLTMVLAGGHPAAAQIQLPLVAVLRPTGAEAETTRRVFLEALRTAGHESGRTIRLIERGAGNDPEQTRALAAEIVALRPSAVIGMGVPASRALKEATSSIPIVAHAGFPVEAGLVGSLARPGGNVTGVSVITNQLDPKRLGLLSEFVPAARRIVILGDANVPYLYREQNEREAKRLSIALDTILVGSPAEIASALRDAKARGAEAVNVLASPMLAGASNEVTAATIALKLPSVCQWREMTEAGCLFSYGPALIESYSLAVAQMDRLLKGAIAAELPVVQPTRFELVINMRTAREIGVQPPLSLLAQADEVME